MSVVAAVLSSVRSVSCGSRSLFCALCQLWQRGSRSLVCVPGQLLQYGSPAFSLLLTVSVMANVAVIAMWQSSLLRAVSVTAIMSAKLMQ